MIYFIIFVSLIFFSYYYDFQGRKPYKNTCYYAVLVVFILLAGLRYRLGVDTIRYENNFQWVPTIFELRGEDFSDSKFDPFYLMLSSIAKTISNEFWVMQLLQATLVNTVIFWFFKKNTKNIFFAVLVYSISLYVNFMCEVMREACAVSMFLLSWEAFKKGKWLKYYVWCMAAFLFHSSAIVLFALPVLKWFRLTSFMKINKYTIPLLLGILVCGYYLQPVLFELILLWVPTERILDKVNLYMDSDLAGTVFNMFGVLSIFIRSILYPLGAIVLLRRKERLVRLPLEPMIFLGFVFAILSIPIAIFYRYNNYFMPFIILILADVVFTEKIFLTRQKFVSGRASYVWVFLFLPFFLLNVYAYFGDVAITYRQYMKYYPYSSVLTKKQNANRESVFWYHGIH